MKTAQADPSDRKAQELLEWDKCYQRACDKQKRETALKQHYQRAFAELRADERLLKRAILGVQLQTAMPCAVLVIGGFLLSSFYSGQRESWTNSGLITIGLLLMLFGALVGGSGSCVAASDGFIRWRESINSRRETLKKQFLRDIEELERSDA